MLDVQTRKEILAKGKPEPQNVMWWGEPNLGGWYTEAEVEAAVAAIRESANWATGFGPNSEVIAEFEKAFARYCGTQHAVAINSGGTGMDIAMMCLGLEPGDEVICPAINFKSDHLAIMGQGGKVVFCDIQPETINLDPEDVEKRITPRTRAIFPVHMNGLSAPMDELIDIAERHPHHKLGPLKVIGDAARACGASYKGTKVGAKGWMNVFSFQTQKHMTTLGEGGMITTDDAALVRHLHNLRQFGGEVEWGTNFKMTKVQAAVGLVQLSRLDEMNRRRREAAQKRSQLLEGAPGLVLPHEPAGYTHIYYVYAILVQPQWAGEKRDRILSIMEDKFGIACAVSNPPTYQRWPYIAKMCGTPILKVSEDIGKRLLCAPLHPLFTEEQELYICASLIESIDMVNNNP